MLIESVSRVCRVSAAFAMGIGFLVSSASACERFEFRHEGVLGTSLEIQLLAVSAEAAERAEDRVLKEIDRLSGIFSSYDAGSEFSRWQKETGGPVRISPELMEVLSACDRWRDLSEGAFHPGVESLTRLWKEGAEQNSLPSGQAIEGVVGELRESQWLLDPEKQTAVRLTAGPLSLNAIAKGFIVERACAAASEGDSQISGAMVSIGGDLRVRGELVPSIKIADPFQDAENGPVADRVFLQDRALASSGNYRRGFEIGGKRYGHLIDPRSGFPTSAIASATVVAKNAADADALATISMVLAPEETARLVKGLPGVEYLLITREGQRISSSGWHGLREEQSARFEVDASGEFLALNEDAAKVEAGSGAKLLPLEVKFELNLPEGGRYRRPYVAVWLEDADEFPVRTGLLWMQTKSPGPRWHRDLLRWYKNDSVRKLAGGKDLIETIAGATRGPGQYKVLFDGKDDAGEPLSPGKYTLFIEVAREHGTYQLIRQSLSLGAEPIPETKLKTNVEIKSASFEYREAAPAKSSDGKSSG